MGGSGKEVIGRGLWASGLTSGSFCSGRAGGLWRGGEVGVGVGDWSLNAPGAPVGMCVVSILRLGPLSVGLAAKSQSGKANFETCAGQLWELSKEPSTARARLAWPLGVSRCVGLTFQAKVFHMGACQFRMYCKYPPPHTLTDKAGLAHALAPAHTWWIYPA